MAGGRQERTDRPAEEGGLHPQGRNNVEDPGAAGVAACRGGPTGQRRPPARPMPKAYAIARRAMSVRPGLLPGLDRAGSPIPTSCDRGGHVDETPQGGLAGAKRE